MDILQIKIGVKLTKSWKNNLHEVSLIFLAQAVTVTVVYYCYFADFGKKCHNIIIIVITSSRADNEALGLPKCHVTPCYCYIITQGRAVH